MFGILIFASLIGDEQEIQRKPKFVCEDIVDTLDDYRIENACEIESVLKEEGFGRELIVAALVNSYAESRFNQYAIGDRGMSVGVFQLRTNGLGGTMSVIDRQDIRKSTKRVVIAIKKSRKFKNAIERNSTESELTKLFCTEIMRPSDKYTKAQYRSELINEIFE